MRLKSIAINVDEFFITLTIPNKNAPKIGGRAIKKENSKANFLSSLHKTNPEIVLPDLEIPGRIATACIIPTIIASKKVISLGFLYPC